MEFGSKSRFRKKTDLSKGTSGSPPHATSLARRRSVRFTMKVYSLQKNIEDTCIRSHNNDDIPHVHSVGRDQPNATSNGPAYSIPQHIYLTAPIKPDVEMYVETPPMVNLSEGIGLRVCKELYGSRQGAQRLDVHKEKRLTAVGFTRSCTEPSLYYIHKDSPFGLVLLTTVVDDFLICCADKYMSDVKHLLTIWSITDHEPADWFINLCIFRDSTGTS